MSCPVLQVEIASASMKSACLTCSCTPAKWQQQLLCDAGILVGFLTCATMTYMCNLRAQALTCMFINQKYNGSSPTLRLKFKLKLLSAKPRCARDNHGNRCLRAQALTCKFIFQQSNGSSPTLCLKFKLKLLSAKPRCARRSWQQMHSMLIRTEAKVSAAHNTLEAFVA